MTHHASCGPRGRGGFSEGENGEPLRVVTDEARCGPSPVSRWPALDGVHAHLRTRHRVR